MRRQRWKSARKGWKTRRKDTFYADRTAGVCVCVLCLLGHDSALLHKNLGAGLTVADSLTCFFLFFFFLLLWLVKNSFVCVNDLNLSHIMFIFNQYIFAHFSQSFFFSSVMMFYSVRESTIVEQHSDAVIILCLTNSPVWRRSELKVVHGRPGLTKINTGFSCSWKINLLLIVNNVVLIKSDSS